MNKNDWGWNSRLEESMNRYTQEGLSAGRIIRENRHHYRIASGETMISAEVSGAFRYRTICAADFPVIGDWVAYRSADEHTASIEAVLPRRSSFSRKSSGDQTEEQILAANIDIAALVFGIDGGRNFTAGALERYLTLAWDSGAQPLILLNKADLATPEQQQSCLLTAEMNAPGVPVHLISAVTGSGISDLCIKAGETLAFIGPSGVGKSTLLNSIAGKAIQKTGEQREQDRKGRHTTTHRELFMLEGGIMIIDSPGLKEIQLWADEQSLDTAFSDIDKLSRSCRFSDCSHEGEPGCAVLQALQTGDLDHRRYENYLDMKKEVRYLQTKRSEHAARAERAKWKTIAKLQKDLKNIRKNDR